MSDELRYDVALITGQRNWDDWHTIKAVMDIAQPWIFIDGACRGADTLGNQWAKRNFTFPIRMPAPWKAINPETGRPYGRGAGHTRNRWMLETEVEEFVVHAGLKCGVFGFKDERRYGPSKGTAGCLEIAFEEFGELDVWEFPRDLGLWLPPERMERWLAYAYGQEVA